MNKYKSNKTIPGGERTIILRVLHFFEEEKRRGSIMIPIDKALARTCAATGVSLSTVTRIKREEKAAMQTNSSKFSAPSTSPAPSSEQATSTLPAPTSHLKEKGSIVLPTPGKKRRKRTSTKIDVDDTTLRSIRNIIHSFQKEKKEVPTLKKILAVAKAELNFSGQKETLRKIIVEKLGYNFRKSNTPTEGAKIIQSESK